MNVYNLIIIAEKCILFFIALFTIFSVGAEMYTVIQNGKIALTDLLLMFIYAEVLRHGGCVLSIQKNPNYIAYFYCDHGALPTDYSSGQRH